MKSRWDGLRHSAGDLSTQGACAYESRPGECKFALRHIDRNDIVSLTREAADVTGIPYIMDSDMKEAERLLCNGV